MKAILFITALLGAVVLTAQEDHSAKNDFDFYLGKWDVWNQRQMDDGSWVEFPATVEVRKTLNGYGNVDFFTSEVNGQAFSGMTVRLFHEASNSWRIYWLDTDDPTNWPEASVGRFVNGVGEFFKTITTDSGQKVRVRFLWKDIRENSFSWECSWSVDGAGKTWHPTWKMEFKRKE